MRLILALLLALPVFAACPTSDGYANRCFVDPRLGSDSATTNNPGTGPAGSINNPYKGLVKTVSVMTAGDRVYLRGGRYASGTENQDAAYRNVGCSANARCTVENFPGEIPIMDGRTWTGAFFSSGYGNWLLDPPYSNDPFTGYWTFSGIKFEQIPRQVFLGESQNDSIHLLNIRITGGIGIRLSSCDGCKLHGVQIDSIGLSQHDGSNYGPFDCTPQQPSNTLVPWAAPGAGGGSAAVYSTPGKDAISPNFYQLSNVPPRFPSTAAYGCRNISVMDSIFRKEFTSSTDNFGIEYGRNVLVERAKFVGPWSGVYEGGFGGNNNGSDAFDMKVTEMTIKDVESRAGVATGKFWGKLRQLQGGLFFGGEDSPQANISLAGSMASRAAGGFPIPFSFNPIRYAGNTPEGDAYILQGNGAYGNGPVEGAIVEIIGVPGCTSINKHVRIKNSVEAKHYIYVLENVDGTQLSCNAPYDLGAHTFRTHTAVVTFTGGGSPNLTIASDTGWSYTGHLNSCITFSTTGTLPAGLTPGICYYTKTKAGTNLSITATPQAGPAGAAAMTFATAGSGVHTATLRDDHTSYAGQLWAPSTAEGRATWGSTIRNVTAISTRNTALEGCYNCTNSDYSARKFIYDIQKSVFVGQRREKIAAPLVWFGGPRAIFSGSTVYLAYHDAGLMAIGNTISFRTGGKLPTQILPNVSYYIVASNNAARTLQIATTPGGSAITFSGGNSRHWAVVPGLSTTNIEISSTTDMTAGATVQFRSAMIGIEGTSLPYPFALATNYTVDSISTVSVNGTSVFLAVVSSGGTPVATTSYGVGYWKMYRSAVAALTPSTAFSVGGFVERNGSADNTYHYGTGAADTRAYCGKVEGDPGFNPAVGTGCAATVGEVATLESGSKIEDPALDIETGRATASTPATVSNRGAFAAWHRSLGVGDTTVGMYNRFPANCTAAEPCVAVVDNNSDFSSPLETVTITSGGRAQWWIFGKTSALTAASVYHYKLTQAFDVVTGTFTTSAALSGTATFTQGAPPTTVGAHTHARLDVSTDGSSWDTSGTNTACASGCKLTSPAIAKGWQYSRLSRTNSGGTILASDAVQIVLVR